MMWLNGAAVAPGTACIDPADRGFTLGDGVFETIAVGNGVPLHLARHLARLRHGAAQLGFAPVQDDATLAAAVAQVAADADVVRMTLTRGPAARGLLPPAEACPTLLVSGGRTPPAGPVGLVLCQGTRRNQHSPLSKIKSLNYLDSVLARQEAERRGADDAVLLNTAGMVAEASAANLIVLRGGILQTPPVADGALPGIARALLMEQAGVRECSLQPEELLQADAMFLCNSLGVREALSLNGQALPRQTGQANRLRAIVLSPG